MTVLEEMLAKTEYIYVLGTDGKPQMPTKRKRHVLKLLNTGRARIAETVPFTVQLRYGNTPVLQPVILAEDPGRTNIGAAALSLHGELLFAAVIETRNKEIKKRMDERRTHRRASRSGERKARQRLAKKHGSMVRSGMILRKLPQYAADRFVTCKFIRNTEARFCNRKRHPGWLTPTVAHLVQTHLNAARKIGRYLPVTDIAFEVNRFAFALMEDPGASGLDFRKGPLKGFDNVEEAVSIQQHGHCMMCNDRIDRFHHIIPKSCGGSDTIDNIAGLCTKCHGDIHTKPGFKEKLAKKKAGLMKRYGALSVLNQAVPFICRGLIEEYGAGHVHFCTGKETSLIRTALGYEKTKDDPMHEADAYCIGLAAIGTGEFRYPGFENVYRMKQFRRQDRARINHQTERTYYLGKQKVAKNRKPRFEQRGDALSDWYEKQVQEYGKAEADKMLGKLTVKKSQRSYNTKDRLMSGTVFYHGGERLVMSGQRTRGQYLLACGDSKTNHPTVKCIIHKQNEGLVFL